MYFAVLEAAPLPTADHSAQYGGATVSFWIKTGSAEDAISRARAVLRAQSWIEVRLIDVRPVLRTDYSQGDPHLEYFDQAEIDCEVSVFYTYPIGPVPHPDRVFGAKAGQAEAGPRSLPDITSSVREDSLYTGYDPNRHEFTNDRERDFALVLDRLVIERGWNNSGLCFVFGVQSCVDFTMGIDIAEPYRRRLGLSLRIDYHEGVVAVGQDLTGQFVTPLDPAHPLYTVKRDGTPEEQAVFAANWLDAQLARLRSPADPGARP